MLIKNKVKYNILKSWAWWYMFIIPATQVAEIKGPPAWAIVSANLSQKQTWCGWHMSVVPANSEAEVWGLQSKTNLRQKSETSSENKLKAKGWVWVGRRKGQVVECKALSSITSTTKIKQRNRICWLSWWEVRKESWKSSMTDIFKPNDAGSGHASRSKKWEPGGRVL